MSEFILPHDITRVTSLKTVGEMLRANGIETAQRDARLLMLAAAGIVHADLLREPRLPLGEEVAERLSNSGWKISPESDFNRIELKVER